MASDEELVETVAVHIKWLRRPDNVSCDSDSHHADNRQSADYLERLTHLLAVTTAKVMELVEERDASRQVAHFLLGDVRPEGDLWISDKGAFGTHEIVDEVTPVQAAAIKAAREATP